jgi:hypothetical protein
MATVPMDDVPAAHTSTDQWQSFEMRMRQRRIVRLLLRAQIAHEAGCDEDAREALAEAERLNEHAPGLAEIRAALEAPPEPSQAVAVVPVAAVAVTEPAKTPLTVTEAFAELPGPEIADVVAHEQAAGVEPAADAPLAVAAAEPIADAPLAVAVPKPIADVPLAVAVSEPIADAPLAVAVTEPIADAPLVVTATESIVDAPLAVTATESIVDVPLAVAEPESNVDAPLAVAEPEPIADAPDENRGTRRWLPRVAAAALIVGALAWFAVPRAFGPTASTPQIADTTAAAGDAATNVATPAAAAPQTSELLEPPAPAELPAVRVAVDEVDVTAAAPGQPAAPGSTATALVGREIPEARSTSDASEPVAPAVRIDTPEPAALPPAIPVATTAPLEAAPFVPVPNPPEPSRGRAEAAVTEPVRDLPPARTVAAPDASVRAILARYESAYSQLDADAAGSVWPAVDRGALARAFDGLASQRVRLGSCDVNVAGETAVAQCNGSATWTPKVGGGTRTQARQWDFRLKYVAGAWQIVGTSVK